ncbi:WD repeat-containing protein 20-like [Ruditapes philippinarum]|uniref:WD repeat-containing protein 20-like n=1 Tax=Ruditapes philippinarum TaxID=129788 RepID=UPI00295A61D1|nr:WD repeat-containing protein 20-like [Ruditapes philippinarum]
MAATGEGGGKEELKTHFITREGTYRLMPLSEYSKPTRVPYNGQTNTPAKVSFIDVDDGSGSPDRICFNVGRELYFYVYKGVRKAADLTKPIDKRVYKGTFPTCHDFNEMLISSESVRLLVGFTAGQVQLIDPIKKELSKLFNEERLIDKTKVTCIKWIPGSTNQFLVSHVSGQMYVYNEELPCGPTPPHYQPFKQGDCFAVYTCKARSTRNPLYRWVIGSGAINEFTFSPCAKYLAVVGQDGYLRVFNYDSMDLIGSMKSYFGGLLCVCWSPDGKYLVTGGEDDLVTVWSFQEKRVICRGQGHKSWVSAVAFDPYTTTLESVVCDSNTEEELIKKSENKNGSNSTFPNGIYPHANANHDSKKHTQLSNNANSHITSYRFGSIGHDTMLCLWDLTEDIIKLPCGRLRSSVVASNPSTTFSSNTIPRCNSANVKSNSVANDVSVMDGHAYAIGNSTMNATTKFATLSLGDRRDASEKKEHKRNFSLAGRSSDKNQAMKANSIRPPDNAMKLLGTPACPRLTESPLLEPLVCKKISVDRLTSLVFREECLVTACQEGLVYTWARPGTVGLTQQHTVVSENL